MTQKTETNEAGARRESKLVRPYLIDLGSTNGCYVNGERIETQRCSRVCVCGWVSACACVHARACACACVRVRACAVHVCVHVCICVCVCRYVELLEKDCLRFGYSSREYVLLNADNQ